MSDLISRSQLISRIESEYREYGEDYDAGQILGDIEDMPMAFDVDKVVAQLERDKFIESETTLSDVHQGYNAGLSRAIEIVKRGGKE